MSSYTKNEIALINFQSDINKLFYYIGEEDDQVPFYALAKFNRYCTTFINSLEIEVPIVDCEGLVATATGTSFCEFSGTLRTRVEKTPKNMTFSRTSSSSR